MTQKAVHFQHTMSLEPFKIKWNEFHLNVSQVSENKDCVVYVAVKYSLQISFSFIVPKNTVTNRSADDFFATAMSKTEKRMKKFASYFAEL